MKTTLLPLIIALALSPACKSAVSVRDLTYWCASTADCAPGYACVNNTCGGSNTADSTGETSPSSDTVATDASDTASTDSNDAAIEVSQDAGTVCAVTNTGCMTQCAQSACPMDAAACFLDNGCMAAVNCYLTCKDLACRTGCVGASSEPKVKALANCLVTHCL